MFFILYLLKWHSEHVFCYTTSVYTWDRKQIQNKLAKGPRKLRYVLYVDVHDFWHYAIISRVISICYVTFRASCARFIWKCSTHIWKGTSYLHAPWMIRNEYMCVFISEWNANHDMQIPQTTNPLFSVMIFCTRDYFRLLLIFIKIES